MPHKFKISHEDSIERSRRQVYDGWTTSQIVDSRIQKYPMCKHIDRRKFVDASLLSNPLSKRSSKKWGEKYARTLSNFIEVRRAWLQAAPGKASSAISELVEKVRSNLDNVTVNEREKVVGTLRVP